MKQVWLVRGSEDGTLGVFSSKKKAMEEALRYVEGEENPEIDEHAWGISVHGVGVYAYVEKFPVL